GHRNDVPGFYQALREFDAALPSFLSALREDDLLFITADHGNDPTTPSTDHARECVPLLALGPRVSGVTIGRRETFADLGATVAEWFGVPFTGAGTSFLATMLAASMASDQQSIVEASSDRVMTMLRERALGAVAR